MLHRKEHPMNTIKKAALAVATSAVVAGGAAVALPAAADAAPGTPGCVTHAEWQYQMHNGLTRQQVANQVGTYGHVDTTYENGDGTKSTYVHFRQCRPSGQPAASWQTVSVEFDN